MCLRTAPQTAKNSDQKTVRQLHSDESPIRQQPINAPTLFTQVFHNKA